MNKQKQAHSFVKQASILAIAGLLVRVLGFAYRIPLTNMIGDEGNGIYAMGFNVYNFFLILSSAGLPVAISKLVAERITLKRYDEAHRVFHVALVISSSLGFLGMLLIWFGGKSIVSFLQSELSYYAMLVLAPTVFLVAIMSVFRGYFQGMHTTLPTASSQVVEQVFNAVFSVVLAYVLMKSSFVDVDEPNRSAIALGAAGGTAGTGIGALFGLLFLLGYYALLRPHILKPVEQARRRFRNEAQTPVKAIALSIFAISIPIIAGTAIFSISNLIDMFMVQRRLFASGILDPIEISKLYGQLSGKYVTITTLPVAISTSLATAAIPSIAASVALKNWVQMRQKINTALRVAMLIAMPSAVGIGVLATPILKLLYPTHPEGGMLLSVGSVSIVFLSFTLILTGMLQGVGKVWMPVFAACCGALVKIPVNYVLIANPNIRVVGAVVGTIVCYMVAAGVNWFFLRRFIAKPLDAKGMLLKPTLAALFMGLCTYVAYYVVVYAVGSNALGVFVSVFVSIVAYFVFLRFINGLKKEDVLHMPMGQKLIRLLRMK